MKGDIIFGKWRIVSCIHVMSLQNMCLFDQCLEIVESIRNGGHFNDEYVEWTSGQH